MLDTFQLLQRPTLAQQSRVGVGAAMCTSAEGTGAVLQEKPGMPSRCWSCSSDEADTVAASLLIAYASIVSTVFIIPWGSGYSPEHRLQPKVKCVIIEFMNLEKEILPTWGMARFQSLLVRATETFSIKTTSVTSPYFETFYSIRTAQ